MSPGVARRQRISALLQSAQPDQSVRANGWVKNARFSKNVSFLHLFDGSTPKTLQVILDPALVDRYKNDLGIGTAVEISGKWVRSPGAEQAWEVHASEVVILGPCDGSVYPIQPKGTSMEFLRTIAHLRPRTNTFQSVFRVRNALSWQIHKFYQERGFLWIHTPILASSDAEGAGELFHVDAPGRPDFFGTQTFLTVSGQLEVECFSQAFTDVYTFGPTFRAENSNTVRHASEFWMIEPEIAWGDLADVMALAEDFVRSIAIGTMEQCPDDFAFFDQRIEKDISKTIRSIVEKPFARITYTEAQEILTRSGRSFENPIGWGTSMQSEHERFLAEEYFKGPVFVTNYPKEQKSFYMRVDEDGRTVAATDLLVPRIGEIIGGSQREERLDVLQTRMAELGMSEAPYWWYVELRKYGTCKHAGFGLGLERMLMWITGMQNIRDVLPFPRTPGNAAF